METVTTTRFQMVATPTARGRLLEGASPTVVRAGAGTKFVDCDWHGATIDGVPITELIATCRERKGA